ncbi:hypothetical protein BDZ89DRAFT_1069602 [Hymenopellis radicata]|nr:hypothetical protein BDZ89DRAFT_1069602 [Hymenopellis radicata]
MKQLGISRHNVSVRVAPRYHMGRGYRHTLNISLLQSLVETLYRAAPRTCRKREKACCSCIGTRDKTKENDQWRSTYPTPIFHQTLSLHYTTAIGRDTDDEKHAGWPDEEASLVSALDALEDSENTVDFGAVSLVDAEGELVGAADDSTGEKSMVIPGTIGGYTTPTALVCFDIDDKRTCLREKLFEAFIQPTELLPTLLPFQRRSLAWLLGREGKTVSPTGEVISKEDDSEYTFWHRVDVGNSSFYFNRFTGEVAKSYSHTSPARGGILAEEPGLGKTLEIISLILSNPASPERNPVDQVVWDPVAEINVKGIKTTLIVTPPALASQWMDELALHAPTLKVLLYEGWSKLKVPINAAQVEEERQKRAKANKKRKGAGPRLDPDEVVDWCTYVNGFDVVVTTYTDLRNDLNIARPIPKRPRREDVVYSNLERPRSPLIMCEWQRVVMDEVQMVGGGKIMVSLIPRVSSWAVSGTPARAQVSDLIHVLKFLRVDKVIGGQKAWDFFIKRKTLLSSPRSSSITVIRTMKSTLKDELTIPQQMRFLVPVGIGRVERHVYDQALEAVLLELGLDARGVAATSGWEVDAGVLRACIRRLRVGQLQRNDRFYKPGALKTMEEVLQGMQDQNWRSVMDDQKSKILLEAEKECNKLLDDITSETEAHAAKGEVLMKEHAAQNAKLPEKTPIHRNKRHALRQRAREVRIVLHRVKFLQGDVYNVLGESFAAEEAAAYGFCEELRRELLKVTAEDANSGMAELDIDATKHGVDADTLMVELPYLEDGGLKSVRLVDEFHEIVEDVLNVQSKLLWEWRTQMHRLLTQKLAANEGDADGQEYQRSLDDQGEAETYLQAYTALLADRRQALVNERTLLAAHDAREKRLRHTKAAMKAATAAEDIALDDAHADIELQPEHEVLRKQMAEERKDLLKALDSRSIKSILVDMSTAYAKLTRDTDPEKILLKQLITDVRDFMADQGKALDKLDADLVLFRKAFNQRILYFRQLQEISDTVTQVTWEGQTYEEAVQECEEELASLEASLKTNRARQRYMDNLQNKDPGDTEDDDDDCVLCGSEFERGFITAWTVMKTWIQKKEGKVCPVCRVPIDPNNLQRFSVNRQTNEKPALKKGELSAPSSRRKIEYNVISPDVYDVIQNLKSFGDYGRKIQTLVQHLLYIQETDPGSKSIVFSAWADSLHILERALTDNAIGCLRIDQKAKGAPAAKRFKNEPDIQVLLLHGERENAGLNITCASRVFLLESVVQHGFEIQAIARIDRLGQTRTTEVYCYYAEDTIEKSILDMAARRGLSLYTKENSAGTLDVSSLNKADDEDKTIDVSSKKKNNQGLKGDFISKVDDMLAILFPHMYEDLEFLLPDADGDVAMEDHTSSSSSAHEPVNAVAGPSRSRRK